MDALHELVRPNGAGNPKFIFFSGKGGVGKSTMSCATAVWLAEQGHKTLLVTTDPAPNLADIFGQKIGHHITPIAGVANLFAIEINPDVASEEYRERIIAPMRELLDEKNIQTIKEQLKSPCVEEVAAFDKFIEFMDDSTHDVVVFDTAPTGHTIRLLELPSGWSDELAKGGATCIGPSNSLQEAKTRYARAVESLKNPERTSFVFVLKPEQSAVNETKRSADELVKLGIKTSLLIINGILPEEVCTDDFFKAKKDDERQALADTNRIFEGVQQVLHPLRPHEISRLDPLREIGAFLYENKQYAAGGVRPRNEHAAAIITPDLNAAREKLTPKNGTRYLFFTGKGGVGKSTIASATAVYLANQGHKTLIVTTDPAAHLQDILGQPVDPEPTRINGAGNLYAARIDQKKSLEEYSQRILEAIKDKDESTKRSVEEDLRSPCAEEMAAFEKFMSYFQPLGYDVVIFDTAPTGHTLRLLELPTDWKGFIDLGTLTKETSSDTMNTYTHVISAMKDPAQSSFIFVMFPEYTPIIEAWRASEELHTQVGITTALVVVNYLLPEQNDNAFFIQRREQQQRYLQEIQSRFKTPIVLAPLLAHEPKQIDALNALGRHVWGDMNDA